LRIFLKCWDPHHEDEEIEVFIGHVITSLQNEEEASIMPTIEDHEIEDCIDEYLSQELPLEYEAHIEDEGGHQAHKDPR
jgi:hypothetical protein